MHFQKDRELMQALGLRDSNINEPTSDNHKNLWWSFSNGERAFGFGDLNQDDLFKVLTWLSNGEPGHSSIIFTGWNEHHDSDWQQTTLPIVRIAKWEGITFPNRESRSVLQ